MKKIISLFQRNYDGDRLVRNEVTPGAEWVVNGEGLPFEKIDGTCCLIKGNDLYKRYDSKNGKTPPEGFIPAQDPDPVTGHWPGWVKVGFGNDDKWHREALNNTGNGFLFREGTYELVGPKIQGNPHRCYQHILIYHKDCILHDAVELPRDFVSIREYLKEKNKVKYFEGIVFHHSDGRMVKIKARDFGVKLFPPK